LPGWSWTPSTDHLESMVSALTMFVLREGHANVPSQHVEEGNKLGSWLNGVRVRHRRGKLDGELVERLSSIKGFTWEPRDDGLTQNVDLVVRFYEMNPTASIVKGVVLDGKNLRNIVVHLRRQYLLGQLRPDLVTRLENVPQWSWDPFDDAFNLGLRHLRTYVQREGHALVPQIHVEDGFRLGAWVSGRRSAFRRGGLRPEHVQQLEQLPGWTWKPPRGPRK
jgi:hypothetical protein